MVPFANVQELFQAAVVQQIAGSGNLAVSNAPGSTFYIYQCPPNVPGKEQLQLFLVKLVNFGVGLQRS